MTAQVRSHETDGLGYCRYCRGALGRLHASACTFVVQDAQLGADGRCKACDMLPHFVHRHWCNLLPDPRQPDDVEVRHFSSGATRDSDAGKLDFEGFLDPLVLWAFGEYMQEHQRQADGEARSGDNWQKGIPLDAYAKSLVRHVLDLWLLHRGHKVVRPEDGHEVTLDEALGACLFNIQGYWHETLKIRDEVVCDYIPDAAQRGDD